LLDPCRAALWPLAKRETMGRSHVHSARLLASAGAVALAMAVAGCATTPSSPDVTGSIATDNSPRTEAEWRREIDVWGPRYRANQSDSQAAIRYAQALRAIGQRAQATAVLEQATISNPHDQPLLGAYGRALADNGNYGQALEVLNRAHSPDRPDWRILSVQGAALDQLGRHGEAQRYYASALRLVPNEPSVLSNLGLSYALSKNLPQAESTLRQAAQQKPADSKIRQNLALVIGLQGRFAEAEKIVRADLSPEEAAQNVAYLRQMIAERNDLKKLSRPGGALAPSS
jgi:Flp pilus assembly protein TadD